MRFLTWAEYERKKPELHLTSLQFIQLYCFQFAFSFLLCNCNFLFFLYVLVLFSVFWWSLSIHHSLMVLLAFFKVFLESWRHDHQHHNGYETVLVALLLYYFHFNYNSMINLIIICQHWTIFPWTRIFNCFYEAFSFLCILFQFKTNISLFMIPRIKEKRKLIMKSNTKLSTFLYIVLLI